MKFQRIFALISLILFMRVAGAGPCDQDGFADKTVQQSRMLDGQLATFDITIGFTPIMNGNVLTACMFSTSYRLKSLGAASFTQRPLSFLMNGGPGFSSATIAFGGLSPFRLDLGASGVEVSDTPKVITNKNTLLLATDLVFVDPIGTGYSFLAPGHDLNEFQGVRNDASSIAHFITTFMVNQKQVPFYIVGESYSGIRVPAIALELRGMPNLTGLILISPWLEGTASEPSQPANSLSIAMLLPSLATTAWYHGLLNPALQKLPLEQVYQQAMNYSEHEMLPLLESIDPLTADQMSSLRANVTTWTAFPAQNISVREMSGAYNYWFKSLPLAGGGQMVSFYDSRLLAPFSDTEDAWQIKVSPLVGRAVTDFLTTTMGVPATRNYVFNYLPSQWPLEDGWLLGSEASSFEDWSQVLSMRPDLKVAITSGYYDLVCPMGEVLYSIARMKEVNPNADITLFKYPSGHMVYSGADNARKLLSDLKSWGFKELSKSVSPK